VVEAGVAVANRLTASAAAAGSRVAGRERIDGKPGDADLPVEECAKSAALFPLRSVEDGARVGEHVALELPLGLAEANRFLCWDDRAVGKTKVPRIVPTNSFRGQASMALE
jgi:hypothetical protein